MAKTYLPYYALETIPDNKLTKETLRKLSLSDIQHLSYTDIEKISKDKNLSKVLAKNVSTKVNSKLRNLRTYYEKNEIDPRSNPSHIVREQLTPSATQKVSIKDKNGRRKVKKVNLERYDIREKTPAATRDEILRAVKFLKSQTSTVSGIKEIEKKRRRSIEDLVNKSIQGRKQGYYNYKTGKWVEGAKLSDEEYKRVLKMFEKMREKGVITGDSTYRYEFGSALEGYSIKSVSIKRGKNKKGNATYTSSISNYTGTNAVDVWLNEMDYLLNAKEKEEKALKETLLKLESTTPSFKDGSIQIPSITPIFKGKPIPGIPNIRIDLPDDI